MYSPMIISIVGELFLCRCSMIPGKPDSR
jgi:hypothetical protein